MTVAVVRDGAFRVRLRQGEFWEKFDAGVWEPATMKVFQSRLGPGSVHVDIGAWIGPTVLLAASLAERVVAFEPDPIAHEELLANLALNPELRARTVVHQAALSTRDGDATMLSNSAELGDSGTSLVHRRLGNRSSTQVKILDAARVVGGSEFDGCSFVKIDVEGSEYSVVPRMGKWLRRQRPDIFLGLHGYPFFERYTRVPHPVARHLRRAAVLRARTRLFWALRTHRHWYLPDDTWSVTNDSWAERPAGLHLASTKERLMVVTKVREIDILLTVRRVPEFEHRPDEIV